MEFLERIKKIRKKKGYSQKYMAEKLNLSVSGYGKIETGENILSVERFLNICRILEISSYRDLLPEINSSLIEKFNITLLSVIGSNNMIRSNSIYINRIVEKRIEDLKNEDKDNNELISDLEIISAYFTMTNKEVLRSDISLRELLDKIMTID